MPRLLMLLFAIEVVLVVLALISCLAAEAGEVRTLPRVVWVIIILLLPLVGSIAYFVAGWTVSTSTRGNTWRPGSGFPEQTRPKRALAPDDDPDFLQRIDQQSRQNDDELLRRWEEDLKKRENDLRKREDTPPTDG